MTEQEWLNNNQLSLDIWNKKYRYNNETFEEWLDRVSGNNSEIKRLIREKKFLFGGRTLANRGIKESGSYANCYSIGYVPDTLDGIMDTAHKIAMTFKAQGGQGLSLSKIRPKGTLIKNKYESDGIIPFMHIFDTVTSSTTQGGSRKGALLMSLDVWHKDIKDFITIKNNPNEINKANLSVEIDDKFMRAIDTNKSYTIDRDYSGNKCSYKINPQEIYKLICKSARDSAEPGIIFTDTFRNYNLMEFVDEYKIETCNPCGEQPLPKHGACNLCSINLSEYVINPFGEDPRVNVKELEKDVRTIVRAMDNVLEENLNNHALEEQRYMAKTYRNIGIGIMGLADMFVKLKVVYGSGESVVLVKSVINLIFKTALDESVILGREKGSFPGYNENVWKSNIIKNNITGRQLTEYKSINCLRNCSLLSIAPTGSLATMLNVSTGVEPFFALQYNRRTESLNGKSETYKVNIKALDEYQQITGNNDISSYFITSKEIDWRDRIDIQSALQYSVDTAISSTINLPKETTYEDIECLYKYAWKKKLKGITIYVEGSRDAILSTDNKEENKQEPKTKELKRGEVVKADNSCIGLKRDLLTGCGSLHCQAFFDSKSKELRECYLSKGSLGGCQNYMIGLSRMISLSARGGLSINAIVDQLKSCGVCPSYAVRTATKKDTSKGSCCPVAVGNALLDMYNEMQETLKSSKEKQVNTEIIKEMPKEELEECPNCHEKSLTRQGGCFQCLSCGFSRCD